MTDIAIIIGSTRPGRRGAEVARWVHEIASQREDANYTVVDIADYDLPMLDEPHAAAKTADYRQPHTQTWSATINSFDGFVFVTPEYNHSLTGALKNALDFLYQEWNNKAAGFVGYGPGGAIRAVEHLRLIGAELKLADVRTQVALSMFTDFEDAVRVKPAAHQEGILTTMLDELVTWADALKATRNPVAVG
ncbi:MAG: reductase [Amycolatopsis sp.]|jgi:NAD(P)H-dependent FMN reductase|uniref:NADPH-dependent FMN reductase n=1 Tax=Amycolatopsis sp. TaxID=37632 RepID=UPI0026162618|nr:NAD(P)H-dependent oxidoreductase [Amycolatopsis sp.]MCU1681317.1 reductase [Amycolatopsis sp.]